MQRDRIAKRYLVTGRVQGVGFRYFVQKAASGLRVTGYTRNLDNGDVEVYAVGSESDLSALSGLLRKGPPLSEVRHVAEQEANVVGYSGFRIERH